MKKVWLFLLLAALAAADASAAASAAAPEGSLEKLLREVRRRREASAIRLAEPVANLVQALDAAPVDAAAEVARIQTELIALGIEAAPLLVPRIDPGGAAGGPEKRLALRLVGVLEALPTRAVTDALVRMSREGSHPGRLNAMAVLATSLDHDKASAALIDAYRHSTGALREQALRSIARLGGPANEAILEEALRSTEPDALRAVLVALTEVGSTAGRLGVRDLADSPKAAAPLVQEILAYYRALARRAPIEQDDVAALLRLAADDAPPKGDRVATLDAIPGLVSSLDTRTKRLIDPLLSHADDELREGAQICLALLGDRNARRDVIKRYNDLVTQNDAWAGAYEQRAAVLARLREYVDAAKDYRRAIKIYSDMGRTSNLDPLYVALARTYARDGSPKRAHDALVEGNLPRSVLQKLRSDPDFADVAAHSRYGKVFDV